MNKINRKSRVALLSVLSNTMLIILKIIAGFLSGSVSIISEAIHSSMDLVASIIALFSVCVSSKPADKQHPYGHGKIENISGVIEGLLIFIAAFLIIKESVNKILNPSEITGVSIGIIVMGIAAIANFMVSRALYKVAKEEDSIALEADALHLKTDVYTSLGVAIGLLLIKLTGIAILDPIVAILVAMLIIKEAWSLCTEAFGPLLDTCLPENEEKQIQDIIAHVNENIIDCHSLRTRKAGHYKYIDLHLVVKSELTVTEAHDICDEIEKTIEENIINSSVNIHVEPEDMVTKD